MSNSSFIIGSGPSLLGLSNEEIAYLNAHPRTLSLNQYLLYWKLVGVLPGCNMMADAQYPVMQIFFDTLREIRRLEKPIKFYFHRHYLDYFPRGFDWNSWRTALRKRHQLWKKFSYAMPWRVNLKGHQSFHQHIFKSHPKIVDEAWTWARSLDEPLFFWRGTLTSAINLAAVIWPGTDIKLLGVDLNSYGYFFDPKRGEQSREDLHAFNEKRAIPSSARHHRKSHKMNLHATAVEYETETKVLLPPIQAAFPRMQQELAKHGNSIFCCNTSSLLVSGGNCEFRNIID